MFISIYLLTKKIDDPFFRDNESKLQWIEKVSWEYRSTIDVPASLLARKNVDLVFDGLDAACDVSLNGVEVLKATNSFRVWRVPAKANLHVGKNLLRVVFPSPISAAAEVAAGDAFRLRSKTDDKTYIRKPAYEYGWDWGPTFVTSGIWRPVRLEAWDNVRIADFAIRQRDVSKEVAHADAEVEVEAAVTGPTQIKVSYLDGGKSVALIRSVSVHAGTNVIDLPIEIRQPKLWYPAGYGDQALYEFTAQLSTGPVAPVSDARKTKAGLRSIVLDRHLDQWGRSFQLVVKRHSRSLQRGADVIPFDGKLSQSSYDCGLSPHSLESAKEANMNTIRHWGGGYYETDEFYQICDELGIMVWQDFMFGNDWQPGTYALPSWTSRLKRKTRCVAAAEPSEHCYLVRQQ